MHSTNDEKREIIRMTWLCENTDKVPFIVEAGDFHLATTEYFDSDATELAWNENYYQALAEVDDYNFPNIKPNLGIGIIAAAFGCEYVPNDVADPWVKPLIDGNNIQDIYKLQIPDPDRCPIYKKFLKRIEFLGSNSELPLRLVNVPSPLVTASLIWDYTSFIEGTILHPAEVHALLEMITEATIGYVKLQISQIKHLYTMGHEPWFIPPGVGIRISDDTAAIMSPDTYREFGVKYNQKISEAFGGIIIHSCGNITHVLPAMVETEGVRGIDLVMPQNNWQKVKEISAGKVALNLRHYYWDHNDLNNVDLFDYSQELIDFFGRRGVLLLTSTPTYEEAADLSKKLLRIL